MTRSTISPLRRFAAAAAIAGVTAFGAVALAPAALADEPAATATTSATAPAPSAATDDSADYAMDYQTITTRDGQQYIISPVPDKAIDMKIGKFKIKVSGWVAQAYQTVEANLDVAKGLSIWFDKHGVLQVGKPKCDPNKGIELQLGCIMPTGGPHF